jgi:hypothetical protein
VEHGVGGVGAGHPPAFGAQRLDRRLDDLDLLAAERAAFAGMGIEPGDREPRLGDPEIALQAAQRRPPARLDQRRASASGTSAAACGSSPAPSAGRPGEHHRDIGWRHAAALGDELGLAGMAKPMRRAAPWTPAR